MTDAIIIGAGPAGLTAALYLLRANKSVLILEAKSYGGQIINASLVENYPGYEAISGFDWATNLYNQVKKLGGVIKYEAALRVEAESDSTESMKKVVTAKGEYEGQSVIIATGAANRSLNIPGEKELIGRGVSYCATCDGNFYRKKVVAVNGGGNTALEDALYLANLAEKVYVIHRRDEFRAEAKYVEELKQKENVEFILNSRIVELKGDERLEALVIADHSGATREVEVAGIFVAIGQEPKNEAFANVVELDEKGYIVSMDGVHTKTEGIYVAGDTRVKDLRQLTTAVSDGSIAATVAMKEMK